jgi:anti-sigma regulatory factor (Ser/Thr protein kinase)
MACQVILADRPLIDEAVAVRGHCDLPPSPQATPLARKFVAGHLAGVAPDVVADVELLTSELVTNVILHARTHVHVGIAHDADNVLVVVQDFSDKTTAERADTTAAGLRESGRGMAIVASLADDFGWKRLPDEVGKVMWFAIGLHARPATDARVPLGEMVPEAFGSDHADNPPDGSRILSERMADNPGN